MLDELTAEFDVAGKLIVFMDFCCSTLSAGELVAVP
jgi:hypothetical protein